ncbi:hypothetical protein L3Y34_005937 [Caenorhabditis briggsae]|uniref:Uncharacterized protein n=1 Tax=Caenorhabditis briggsae TaxID=6238 RepID=A0AAE9CYK0_CAEBR|nr:hypothetical protein L3Y34_005937 [Caenorhabditis briggsae]
MISKDNKVDKNNASPATADQSKSKASSSASKRRRRVPTRARQPNQKSTAAKMSKLSSESSSVPEKTYWTSSSRQSKAPSRYVANSKK